MTSGLLQLHPNTVLLLHPAVVMDEEGMPMKAAPLYPASMLPMMICLRVLPHFLVRPQLLNPAQPLPVRRDISLFALHHAG
jgi:hypothetical protein